MPTGDSLKKEVERNLSVRWFFQILQDMVVYDIVSLQAKRLFCYISFFIDACLAGYGIIPRIKI